MSLNRACLEYDNHASQHAWSSPLAMFIAWLVRTFDQIVRPKRIRRTTGFKSNWRDHWAHHRQLEWIRDQILAPAPHVCSPARHATPRAISTPQPIRPPTMAGRAPEHRSR
jgi:hypothetical protein